MLLVYAEVRCKQRNFRSILSRQPLVKHQFSLVNERQRMSLQITIPWMTCKYRSGYNSHVAI